MASSSSSSSSSSLGHRSRSVFIRVMNKDGGMDWYKTDAGEDATLISLTVHPFDSTVVGLDSKLYCLGGRNPLATNKVSCFDTENPGKGWRPVTPMCTPRINPHALVVDGKIFVFAGFFDLELDLDGGNFDAPGVWGEYYDPNHSIRGWTKCTVNSLDGESYAESALPELLNTNPPPGAEWWNENGRNFLPVKKNDREIFIFTDSKGSFVYNIECCSLTTLSGIQLPQELVLRCHSPSLIDNCIYFLYGDGCWRFNMDDGCEQSFSLKVQRPGYLPPAPRKSKWLHVVRTDGINGYVDGMIHAFRKAGYHMVGQDRKLIVCYICASVPAGNEKEFRIVTCKYFYLPETTGLMDSDIGVLL